MRKLSILIDVLSQESTSKTIFRFFYFYSLFQKKNGKDTLSVFVFFFSKIVILVKIQYHQCNFCEISFLKMYTFINFHAMMKKLCCPIQNYTKVPVVCSPPPPLRKCSPSLNWNFSDFWQWSDPKEESNYPQIYILLSWNLDLVAKCFVLNLQRDTEGLWWM